MNVQALADPAVESGVPHGRALLEFASAAAGVAAGSGSGVAAGVAAAADAHLARTREALRSAMGDAGVADAAAVASNFERMVRIADAIGIELGGWMESFTADVRADLALDRLRTRPEDPRDLECGVTIRTARIDKITRTRYPEERARFRPKPGRERR